jgi:antitoxin ParD1/3/4
MANIEQINISLPSGTVSSIKAAVESGDYATTNEVIREALHDWERKRQLDELEVTELRKLIEEGIDSGPSLEAGEVIAELKARYTAMAGGK